MRRRPAVILLALLAVGALSACTDGAPAPSPTTAAPTTEVIEPGSREPEGAVAIEGAIDDDTLEHTVTATRIVRDAVIPGAEDLAQGGEIVLVELSLTGGAVYRTAVTPAMLSFANPPAASGVEEPDDLSAPIGVQLPEADAAMVAAGYVVLPAAGAGVDETVTGWTAFRIAGSDAMADAGDGATADPADPVAAVLRYTRPPLLGVDDNPIEAEAWEVELVEPGAQG